MCQDQWVATLISHNGEMDSSVDIVVVDLGQEIDALNALIDSMSKADWSQPTPAPGWSVADQVIHIGLFDRRAMWSIADPDRFVSDLAAISARGGVEQIHQDERAKSPSELLEWWRAGSRELMDVARTCEMSLRCKWYGPTMSARSMLTARLMEAWAHAHDIADAIGVDVVATQRLRHVAHIGVRAMPFAFAANRREVPSGDVRVELSGPEGDMWTWGSPDASSYVRGDALGFCQAVTQRRHVLDCGLHIHGDVAVQWMSIAQAFAGPPGGGRTQGQFAK